jgi:hypothetical protein
LIKTSVYKVFFLLFQSLDPLYRNECYRAAIQCGHGFHQIVRINRFKNNIIFNFEKIDDNFKFLKIRSRSWIA